MRIMLCIFWLQDTASTGYELGRSINGRHWLCRMAGCVVAVLLKHCPVTKERDNMRPKHAHVCAWKVGPEIDFFGHFNNLRVTPTPVFELRRCHLSVNQRHCGNDVKAVVRRFTGVGAAIRLSDLPVADWA